MILACAILTSACGGARVEVRNKSAVTLDEVAISANGIAAQIGTIETQGRKATSICPQGEAGALGLSFRANGRTYNSEHALYFECDWLYVINVEVSPTFEAVATSTLR
jgi:hypothetical protein